MFLDAGEAEIARAKLASGGIAAEVFVENFGGEGPRHGRLMVVEPDVGEACEVLGLPLPTRVTATTFDRAAIPILIALVVLALIGLAFGFDRWM